KLDEVAVAEVPKCILFLTEVLQSQTGVLGRRHHLRTPILKILNPAHLHRWIVDIDPVIGKDVGTIENECYDNEIAIAEPFGGLQYFSRRRRIESPNQIADRHRADEVGCLVGRARSGRHLNDAPRGPLNLVDLRVVGNAAAERLDLASTGFPHHAWAKTRI